MPRLRPVLAKVCRYSALLLATLYLSALLPLERHPSLWIPVVLVNFYLLRRVWPFALELLRMCPPWLGRQLRWRRQREAAAGPPVLPPKLPPRQNGAQRPAKPSGARRSAVAPTDTASQGRSRAGNSSAAPREPPRTG